MPSLDLVRISNHICRNTTLSVKDGEMLVLAGSTGAGKTTLLNVIAGLTEYRGQVLFDGKAVDHLPPYRRNVGYLFQDFALFPHLTVYENIAFGLRAGAWEKEAIDERVKELLGMLHLQPLSRRYPRDLSGGEKQRVALARTLAPKPKILLLDEPFSNLDPRTARFLRLDLKKLHRRFGLTAVYVTHNQMEAFEMGDRIAVVSRGGIEQISTPARILFEPQTPAVADLFGAPNIFTCCNVRDLHHGLGEAVCGDLSLIVPYEGKPIDKIAVLPSGIHVAKSPNGRIVPNQIRGRVDAIRRKPPVVMVDIQVETRLLRAELPEHVWDDLGIGLADRVYASIPLKWVQVLEKNGRLRTGFVLLQWYKKILERERNSYGDLQGIQNSGYGFAFMSDFCLYGNGDRG